MTPDEYDGMSLNEFLRLYEEDDNHWWASSSGHHQSWFEQAIEELEDLRSVIRQIDLRVGVHQVDDHHIAVAKRLPSHLTPEQWAAVARSKESHGNRDDDPSDL